MSRRHISSLGAWSSGFAIALAAYILSSGPVIATGFWLREQTNRDEFYAVMFPYYPLIVLGHDTPFDIYIEWWVWFFGTVGPG
jgi:hypothetical protein